MFAFATHEEIGRFGSRVLVEKLRPDVLIAVDVNHDYEVSECRTHHAVSVEHSNTPCNECEAHHAVIN
jgi:putative aminopeptidase FrvX